MVRPPNERHGRVIRQVIGGRSYFLVLNDYSTGRLCEAFLHHHGEDSVRGYVDQVLLAANRRIQDHDGDPDIVREHAADWRGQRLEPRGVRFTSVLDWIGRTLLERYCGEASQQASGASDRVKIGGQ